MTTNQPAPPSATVRSTPESPFLHSLFRALDTEGSEYCVLRNYEGLPFDLQGSDIDVIVGPGCISEFTEIAADAARDSNGKSAWRQMNDAWRLLYAFGTTPDGRPWGVRIDVHTHFSWKGYEYYPGNDLLRRAVTRQGVRVADPVDEALTACVRDALSAGRVRERYASKLRALLDQSHDRIEGQLRALFGARSGALLEHLRTSDDGDRQVPDVATLRRVFKLGQWLRWPARVAARKTKRRWLQIGRLTRRPGVSVAVVGDSDDIGDLLRRTRAEVERLLHVSTDQRHDAVARGSLRSVTQLAKYALGTFFFHWTRVHPFLAKQASVFVLDGYYHDVLLAADRATAGVPTLLIRLFGIFVPSPDLVCTLTEPGAERGAAGTGRMRARTVQIDAASAEEAADEVVREIVEVLFGRLR